MKYINIEVGIPYFLSGKSGHSLKETSSLKTKVYFEYVKGRGGKPYCTHKPVSKIKSWCWLHECLGSNIIFYPEKM